MASTINRLHFYKTDPLPAVGRIYLQYLHSGDGSSSVVVNTYRKKNYFTTLLAFTACLMTGNIMADDAHRERWKIEMLFEDKNILVFKNIFGVVHSEK